MKEIKKQKVEFLDYTGEFPSLCMGTLTLKIEGEIVKEELSLN